MDPDGYLKSVASKLQIDVCLLIFLSIVVVGSVVYWLLFLFTHGHFAYCYFVGDYYNTAMDYFNMLAIAHDDPYVNYPIYPALCFAILGCFYQLLPAPIRNSSPDGFYLRDYMHAQLGYIFFTVICVLVLYELIRRHIHGSENLKTMAALIILISGPMLFTFERGNIILLMFVALFIFIVFYNHENKKLRYLSYFSLSIAVGIKIYPIVFVVLLLNKKRLGEFAFATIIIVTTFLIPFFLFGGFSSIYSMLSALNMTSVTGSINYDLNGNYSLKNIVKLFFALFNTDVVDEVNSSPLLMIVAALVTLIMYMKSTQNWQRIYSLCLFCIWVPGFSYTYTLIIMIIPALMYHYERKYRSRPYIISILFALIFVPYYLPFSNAINYVFGTKIMIYEITCGTIIINFALLAISISIIWELIGNTFQLKVQNQ